MKETYVHTAASGHRRMVQPPAKRLVAVVGVVYHGTDGSRRMLYAGDTVDCISEEDKAAFLAKGAISWRT